MRYQEDSSSNPFSSSKHISVQGMMGGSKNHGGSTACDLSLALTLMKLFSNPQLVHSLWQFSSDLKCVVIMCFILSSGVCLVERPSCMSV